MSNYCHPGVRCVETGLLGRSTTSANRAQSSKSSKSSKSKKSSITGKSKKVTFSAKDTTSKNALLSSIFDKISEESLSPIIADRPQSSQRIVKSSKRASQNLSSSGKNQKKRAGNVSKAKGLKKIRAGYSSISSRKNRPSQLRRRSMAVSKRLGKSARRAKNQFGNSLKRSKTGAKPRRSKNEIFIDDVAEGNITFADSNNGNFGWDADAF